MSTYRNVQCTKCRRGKKRNALKDCTILAYIRHKQWPPPSPHNILHFYTDLSVFVNINTQIKNPTKYVLVVLHYVKERKNFPNEIFTKV